jgi:hypothetical protein
MDIESVDFVTIVGIHRFLDLEPFGSFHLLLHVNFTILSLQLDSLHS